MRVTVGSSRDEALGARSAHVPMYTDSARAFDSQSLGDPNTTQLNSFIYRDKIGGGTQLLNV